MRHPQADPRLAPRSLDGLSSTIGGGVRVPNGTRTAAEDHRGPPPVAFVGTMIGIAGVVDPGDGGMRDGQGRRASSAFGAQRRARGRLGARTGPTGRRRLAAGPHDPRSRAPRGALVRWRRYDDPAADDPAGV